MPWPEFITLQFELVNKFTTEESDYYGPFNALLNQLFPASEYYQIAPQFKRVAGSLDFTIIYLITRRRVPVLFIELKTYVAYDTDSARKAADDRMRDRVLDFTAGSIPIPKLYGLSVLGTRFSIPLPIAHSPRRVSSLIPNLLPTLRPRRDGILIFWNRRAKLG